MDRSLYRKKPQCILVFVFTENKQICVNPASGAILKHVKSGAMCVLGTELKAAIFNNSY